MSDIFGKVKGDQDFITKILSKLPGFGGYIERTSRRSADKLLRETVADRFEEQWRRISSLQRELISSGEIKYIDDLEAAAIKIRQFIDRIRHASYGYSSLFDAVKINEKELAALYEYDLALLNGVDELTRAIDNVETSIGSEGLPASIRNVTSVAQQAVDAFNRRDEVVMSGGDGEGQVAGLS